MIIELFRRLYPYDLTERYYLNYSRYSHAVFSSSVRDQLGIFWPILSYIYHTSPVGLPGDWLQVETTGTPLCSRSILRFLCISTLNQLRTKFQLLRLCALVPGVQQSHIEHHLMSCLLSPLWPPEEPDGSNLEPLGTWCALATGVQFNLQKMLFMVCPTHSQSYRCPPSLYHPTICTSSLSSGSNLEPLGTWCALATDMLLNLKNCC